MQNNLLGNSTLKQSGYILIVFLVILVVGAATWFSSNLTGLNSAYQFERQSKTQAKLQEIKARLIRYAVLTPEIMQTDNSNTYSIHSTSVIPGLGYLPNCDSNGDGQMDNGCYTADFRPQFLPTTLAKRHIYFNDRPKQYYYVIDSRFVIQNSNYNNPITKRFAPLNSLVKPKLYLNIPQGTPDASVPDSHRYVALLFSSPLDAKNNDGDAYFFTAGQNGVRNDQVVVGISYTEWKAAVERRVCNLKTEMLTTNVNEAFWFNAYDVNNNPTGDDWRSLVGGICP